MMDLFGVLESKLPDQIDISPTAYLAPLGTEQDILKVQLDVVGNVRHLGLNSTMVKMGVEQK
jgi:hypothetical protein